MGSTSPQIKAFITLAYEYRHKRTDKILQSVQRQLQILSVVSDLNIFEPSCMETLEFYTCLEQLLTDVEPKSPLAWKVISLLSHISTSPKIRIALRDEIDILPILGKFVTTKLSKDKSQKILQLIEEISYGIKFIRLEMWVRKLISYLVSSILDSESVEDSCEYGIIILLNLCRGNPAAISFLCNACKRKPLVRILSSIRNPTLKLQLLIAELMLYINVDHSKLDNDQIFQTLDLLFTVATDSFAEKDEQLLQLTKDVLNEVVNHSYLQEAIKGYQKFESQCQNLTCYLKDRSFDNTVKILFEFLAILFGTEHPHLVKVAPNVFSIILPWLTCKECGSTALQLLQSLIVTSEDSLIYSHADQLINILKDKLFKQDDFTLSKHNLQWLASILTFIERVCVKDKTLHFKFANCLEPKSFDRFLEFFLVLYEADSSGLYSQDDSGRELASYSLVSTSESSSLNPSKRLKRTSGFSEPSLPAEIVVRLLYAAKLLGVHKPEFLLEHEKMLYHPKVLKQIVACQRSQNEALVAVATKLLSDGNIPSQSISSLVDAQKSANLNADKWHGIEQLTNADRSVMADDTLQSLLMSPQSEENVDTLIARLNGISEKLELKDIPLANVMELYEYKLAAFVHNEETLEKSLAAADDKVRQTKKALLHSKAESSRLRALLKVWENRVQQSMKEKEETENFLSEIKHSSRKLREELVKEKTDMERRLGQKEVDIKSMRAELAAKRDENDRMAKRLVEKNKENDCIKDELEKNKKYFEESQKVISTYEKSDVRLKEKNKELELLIEKNEKTISEKEAENEELARTNSSLKRIQDMIHNISSGKTT